MRAPAQTFRFTRACRSAALLAMAGLALLAVPGTGFAQPKPKGSASSPLGGLAHGGNTFYWNPVYGVNSYRVNVYGVDVNPGALLAQFSTSSTQTSVGGDVGGLPGYQLAWEVQGLLNGSVVCTSPRYTMGHATS